MKFVPRLLAQPITAAAARFPALILTGPRRSGKTTLFRRLFPRAGYHLLEDPDVVGRVRSDPRSFLEAIRPPAILDEIQNAPELLGYIRTRIDAGGPHGWYLTGSQEPALMRGVTESMAGRAAVFHLLPLSTAESPRVDLLRGGFPEVLAHPPTAETWFRSYIQTYLERDIRSISSIRDLTTFRRFLTVAASRIGQVLNKTDLAAPLGVSVPTLTEWLNILEVTHQILLVPPFYENFGKRLLKSPKLYFADTGLAAHLLGIENARQLAKSPFLGPLFESFVAAEIAKAQLNAGRRKELYYFRDRQGLEVDFVVPVRGGTLLLAEAKATRTVRPEHAEPLLRLRRAVPRKAVDAVVVHLPAAGGPAFTAVRPGVRALPVQQLPELI
ncbi:MAG TPA: ATP-binding protein [Acidobacteriota bacterium]|nr:ATP-binding protein [Acidobacteriota bacterium]